MQKLKILLIHQYFLEEDDPGGSRWNEIAKEWTNQGHEITVICGMVHANGVAKRAEYQGKIFKKKLDGDITIWRCHVSQNYNANFLGRLWGYFSFMLSAMLAGLFKIKGRFDVVLVTSPPLFIGFSGYVISRVRGMPMIFEVRDLWPESAIDTGIIKNRALIWFSYWFERVVYRKAKLVNVLTPAFYHILRDKKHVPERKLIMIPNAADFRISEELLDTFDAARFRRENDLDKYFVLLYVGAHGVANHLEQLLDAAEALKDTKALFMFIGQGMEKVKLMQQAHDRQITNVRFLDAVSKREVFKYILACDMGMSVLKKVDIFKTVYSNKTFDYMSCRKPVLMAIDGASRELIESAHAGSYVAPENTGEFNRIIREYMSDASRVECEGNNGYQYARLHFDRQTLAKEYLGYIQAII